MAASFTVTSRSVDLTASGSSAKNSRTSYRPGSTGKVYANEEVSLTRADSNKPLGVFSGIDGCERETPGNASSNVVVAAVSTKARSSIHAGESSISRPPAFMRTTRAPRPVRRTTMGELAPECTTSSSAILRPVESGENAMVTTASPPLETTASAPGSATNNAACSPLTVTCPILMAGLPAVPRLVRVMSLVAVPPGTTPPNATSAGETRRSADGRPEIAVKAPTAIRPISEN